MAGFDMYILGLAIGLLIGNAILVNRRLNTLENLKILKDFIKLEKNKRK